jgi:hypothetical protein
VQPGRGRRRGSQAGDREPHCRGSGSGVDAAVARRGRKGPAREYDWAWGLLPPGGELRAGYARSVLSRRSITDPADIAYYLCFGPEGTGKQQLIRIAGARWGIETCFAEAKGQCGMDHYQVRTWTSWHRHVTLAMFAHAFLQTTAATDPKGAADAIDSARRSSGICWV